MSPKTQEPLPVALRPLAGCPGARFWLAAVVLVGLVVLGFYGYLQQRLHGDIVTGMRSIGHGGVAWGLYIILDITFVGLAFAGISAACIARIFHLRELRPFSRIAGLMSAVALSMAGICVLADLGRPLEGLLNLPKFARTVSPFFGTFTVVVGAGLVAILVLVFLAARADAALTATHFPRRAFLYRLIATGYGGSPIERNRHRIVSRLLALLLLPLMVVSYSTLGFVFGIQSGRPGWFSAMQAPSFLVLAAISGTGMLIFIAGAAERLLGLSGELPERAYRWLSNALLVLVMVFLYLSAVQQLTARYAGTSVQVELAHELTAGIYAPLFWTSLGIFVFSFLSLSHQFLGQHFRLGRAMAIGLLVNVAALIERFLIVVPSQTHGTLLPYGKGVYLPTWVELSVAVGLFSLGALIFMVIARVFPLVPLKHIEPEHLAAAPITRPRRRLIRWAAFAVYLGTGMALATLGFLWSARLGTEAYLDPRVPYSPVVFIAGISMCLSSAVVFELFPRPLPPREDPSAKA